MPDFRSYFEFTFIVLVFQDPKEDQLIKNKLGEAFHSLTSVCPFNHRYI